MMSKEAKIGLIFSLVFIVALAVILRNVHQDGTEVIADNDIMEVDESPVTQRDLTSTVQSLTDDRQMPQYQSNPNRRQETTVANRNPVESNHYDRDIAMVPVAAEDTIRYTRPLPGSNDRANNIRTSPPSGQVQKAINSMAASTQPGNMFGSSTQRNVNTSRPVNTVKPAAKPKKVIHTVVKGDNLTKIAMKYYGKKAGNKLSNIEKIFEANNDILHSISDLKVGQRLTIPQLPDVEIIQSSKNTSTATTAGSTKYKTYIVKEDDSLWKIAAKELGNGTRYLEISKLNSRILSDENTLRPGMKLKLPK